MINDDKVNRWLWRYSSCANANNAIAYNTMSFNSIPCSTMKYQKIPYNVMQYHAIPCNNMQHHKIQCNTMAIWRSNGLFRPNLFPNLDFLGLKS